MTRQTPSLGTSRVERYYNKIVAAFVLLTVALVAVIVYFSFSKTEIVVTTTAVERDITVETTLQEVDGVLLITEAEQTVTYTEIEGDQVPGKAGGTVTIFNNYNQSQPLVETTRLLSEGGVLFRTQETVTVPVGGSVEVAVAADEDGAAGNIGPGRLEVVALWDGLKDRIYAESSEPMVGGLVTAGVVSQNDIANAKEQVGVKLKDEAWTRIQSDAEGRSEGLPENALLLDVDEPLLLETLSTDVDASAGDERDRFDVTQKATIGAPVVNEAILREQLLMILQQGVPEGYELVSSDIAFEDMVVGISGVSDDRTNADLSVTLPVTTRATDISTFVDVRALTHLTETEVQSYLKEFDQIAEVQVHFSPFWVTRTPDVIDNITLTVE